MLSEERLAAIRQRADKATPAPWGIEGDIIYENDEAVGIQYFTHIVNEREDGSVLVVEASGLENPNASRDIQFVGYARTDIPDCWPTPPKPAGCCGSAWRRYKRWSGNQQFAGRRTAVRWEPSSAHHALPIPLQSRRRNTTLTASSV